VTPPRLAADSQWANDNRTAPAAAHRRPQPSGYEQTVVTAVARRDNGPVTADHECLSCAANARPELPPRDKVHVGPRWRAAHAFGTALPGWLVVIPRRHVLALDELTPEESADLGPLLSDLTAALREVVHCEKTYVALFAEAEGFAHLHFHLIPRPPSLDAAYLGPAVFGLLGGDPAHHVPDTTRDHIAVQLSRALQVRR
jgi:diadenosine tetraphosphate (Ap4A) HIT family hydrolase